MVDNMSILSLPTPVIRGSISKQLQQNSFSEDSDWPALGPMTNLKSNFVARYLEFSDFSDLGVLFQRWEEVKNGPLHLNCVK